jgi:ParB-like chromosome segregation protein Spo0J
MDNQTAIKDSKLRVEYKPIKQLLPYARNARRHSDKQVQQIAESIKQFGFTSPVLLDGENGILAGHGRVLAALLLNLEQVPCINLKHLNEQQKRAYVIADNKLALNASWDMDLLAEELHALKGLDFPVTMIGFSDDEMSRLADDLDEKRMAKLAAANNPPSSNNAGVGKDEADYLPLSVMLRADQRELVYRAIRLAKENQQLAHTHDALTFICRRYVNE